MRSIVFLTILAGTVQSAPIPPVRIKPLPVPTTGEWILNWGGADTSVTLGESGAYQCMWSGGAWSGSWAWDSKERTLHICESGDGRNWLTWYVQMDEHLSGLAKIGVRQVQIKLERRQRGVDAILSTKRNDIRP